jgi:membrane fusion protein (multidrug efflux system)
MTDTPANGPGAAAAPGEPADQGGVSLPRRPRRIVALWIVACIGLVAGVAYGVHWYVWGLSHERTDDAQVEGHIHVLSAKVPGYVAETCITDNQRVSEGDVLVRIEDADYQCKVKGAEAELAQAEAALAAAQHNVAVLRGTTTAAVLGAEAGVRQAEAQLEADRSRVGDAEAELVAAKATRDQALAMLKSAEAHLDHAIFESQRVKDLQGRHFAAAEEINLAETGLQAAEGDRASAEAQVGLAEARVVSAERAIEIAKAAVSVSEATVEERKANLQEAQTGPDQVQRALADADVAQAKVLSARAQLELARLDLGYCTITAPVNGIVSRRSVESGQFLQPGLAILAIVPLEDTWVLANFKETELKNMRPGQPAVLQVDAYPDHPFAGRVDSIAAGTGARFSIFPPENATGNYVKIVQRIPVKIVLEESDRDPDRPLRPGMNVVVTVDTKAPASQRTP